MSDQKSNIDTLKERNFLYLEAAENPLTPVDNQAIMQNIIDPTTGHPYVGGILLEGEFASLGVLNNNNRIYTEDNYIQFVTQLKKQIHSPDGVYGELEHPKGYATDWNNVSHKLVDIWYNKEQQKVFGIVLVLATEKGKIVQEIIKSGGRVGISARAGGKEVKNPDGTVRAELKMMVTYDLVYHPGFTSAKLGFMSMQNLNESERMGMYHNSRVFTIYETNLGKLDSLYESFVSEEGKDLNFLQWVSVNKLFESAGPKLTPEEKRDQEKLATGETNNEDKVENELSSAVDKELNQEIMQEYVEELNEKKKIFESQMQNAQLGLGRKMRSNSKLGKSYYDNSAGFVTVSEDENEI